MAQTYALGWHVSRLSTDLHGLFRVTLPDGRVERISVDGAPPTGYIELGGDRPTSVDVLLFAARLENATGAVSGSTLTYSWHSLDDGDHPILNLHLTDGRAAFFTDALTWGTKDPVFRYEPVPFMAEGSDFGFSLDYARGFTARVEFAANAPLTTC